MLNMDFLDLVNILSIGEDIFFSSIYVTTYMLRVYPPVGSRISHYSHTCNLKARGPRGHITQNARDLLLMEGAALDTYVYIGSSCS